MTDNYFDTKTEFEEVQRLRRQRMVKKFIGQQEKAMRPMLLEALRRDLQDLKIVIELEGSSHSSSYAPEAGGVDESVIMLILQHCPSATRTQVIDAMRAHQNDIGKVINLFHRV